MHNAQRCHLTKWQIRLASAIMLWAAQLLAWGQSYPPPRPTGQAVRSDFAAMDESLASKADSLLNSREPFPIAASSPAQVDELRNARLMVNFGDLPSSRTRDRLLAPRARLDRLRPAVEPILQQSGVPVELAAMILVESGGRTTALSAKGALGLWQLMPATARRYGLRVDNVEDDRLDIEKSTRGAARYLNDLHLQFGSWTLALAAYNTGEQNVQRAISRSQSTEFTVLSSLGLLPLETRNYVPAVMTAIQSFNQSSALREYHRAVSTTTVFATSTR